MKRALPVAVVSLGLLIHSLGCSSGDGGSSAGGGGAAPPESSSTASSSGSSSSSTSGGGGGGGGGASCVPVDDGDPCTDDVCENDAPVHKPTADGAACADGDACTQTDTCQAGACVGGDPVICDGGTSCVAGECACTGTLGLPGLPSLSLVSGHRLVGTADLNGDGKLDVVTRSAAGTGVTVWLNEGKSEFSAPVTYVASPTSLDDIEAADLNGDGKPDLATVSTNSGLSVLFNQGDGTFAAPVSYAADAAPISVAAADLNGDGMLDLAVMSIGLTSGLGLFFNQGNGAFIEPAGYGGSSGNVEAVDLNGDTRADLVIKDGSDVIVYISQGDGSLSYLGSYSIGENTASGLFTAADLNGDSKPDIAYESVSDVGVLYNQGDGSLGPPVKYPAGGSAFRHMAPVAVDVNSDGLLDLVRNADPRNLVVLLNQGGTFAPPIFYAQTELPIAAAAGDLNGDGKADLALLLDVPAYMSNVLVLANQGDGTFVNGSAVTTALVSSPMDITAADLNNDGRLDFAVYTLKPSPRVKVLLNQGGGAFAAEVSYDVAPSPFYSGQVVADDVNGDGLLDLVAMSSPEGGKLSVLINQGGGAFAAAVNYPAGNECSALAVADVSGDGRPDIVVLSSYYESKRVLLNNGDGTFAAPVSSAAGSVPAGVAVADLNADGKLDLAITNRESIENPQSADVSVWINQGDATFVLGTTYGTGYGAGGITAIDMNADGSPDLVATNASEGEVRVWLNKGDGTLGPVARYEVGTSACCAQVADMNGDGMPDVVLRAGTQGSVVVLLNKGGGVLGTALIYSAGPSLGDMAVLDLNDDSRLDVAVVNGGTDDIRGLINACLP